jgi:hypothetical protein
MAEMIWARNILAHTSGGDISLFLVITNSWKHQGRNIKGHCAKFKKLSCKGIYKSSTRREII